LPVLEIAWGRYLFYALSLVPLALIRYKRAVLQPARPRLQLLRGVLMAFSALMFFSAIAYMPLADTMAVFFIYPFVVLLGSAVILHETIGYLRWAMVAVGFVGAALVIRPAVGEISPGVPYALLSGLSYAASMLATRKLGAHDPALLTAAISALLGAIAYSMLMPVVWVTPAVADWPLMILMGIIAAIGHFLIVHAHRLATASQLAPFGYTEIASALVLGLVIFGDIPTLSGWLGIALIIGSGIVAMRVSRPG
jgi:drug/metabolite transporter (DMT)-like permease